MAEEKRLSIEVIILLRLLLPRGIACYIPRGIAMTTKKAVIANEVKQSRGKKKNLATGLPPFCHSVPDTESGKNISLWIPAPDQVEGMLSRE